MAPSHYTQERKGFWHEPDGTPTSEAIALETWARTARDVLVRTAATYHAVIRDTELAEELQATTGIRTTRSLDRWLPKILGPIDKFCEHAGEPALTSLVVGTSDDLETARARLECYRWAGSAPADGGVPAQLPGSAPRRASRPRTAIVPAEHRPSEAPRGQDRPARRGLPVVLHGAAGDRRLRQLRLSGAQPAGVRNVSAKPSFSGRGVQPSSRWALPESA